MSSRNTIAADGTVIAERGVVATSERQAAEVGAGVLRAGGNAVDAALATAACLTVTEPTGNGLGGDLLALVFDGARVRSFEAVGQAPGALTLDEVRRLGHAEMPLHGWLPVTVPGQAAGWGALHETYGSAPLADLLAPAIRLGREGCTISPVIAAAWRRAAEVHGARAEWREVFMPGGSTPEAGSTFRNPALASSLEIIARRGTAAFYDELGEHIVRHAQDTGGCLRLDDLRAYSPRWVEALACDYGPYRVFGAPAPTQGAIALEALGILDGLADGAPEVTRTHRAIEAIKLAFADGYAALADPDAMRLEPSALLEPDHLARRRARIADDHAGPSPARAGLPGGTVLVCAGDSEGRMISLLQSNFHGFGSGIVVPDTGISLHNRGAGFSLDPDHPNALAPGKRPFHTLLPGMLARRDGGQPLAAFGCMGGQMQPQGHVQIVASLAAGDPPQTALARPRWRWLDGGTVLLEEGFDLELARALEARGHRFEREGAPPHFGGAQLVMRRAEGGYIAGSDPRKGGAAIPA